MTFARMQDIAQAAVRSGSELGFDRLEVTAMERTLLGVRLAQSAICRENVAVKETGVEIAGSWRGRQAALSLQPRDVDTVLAALMRLRSDLEQQAADLEHVPYPELSGTVVWDVARGEFGSVYAPEILYPLLAKHAASVQARGMRLTGYFEAQERNDHSFIWTPTATFDLRQRDHGFTFNVTVDRDGAVGSTSRASVHASAQVLDDLIGAATAEAAELCAASGKPQLTEPGDYTLVMHPAAVNDLLHTALYYGLFDQRKVDEGRTYLSGKLDALSFPKGLCLGHRPSLNLPSGPYSDSPLTSRLAPNTGLELIGGGKVSGLYRSAFWAKTLGETETCSLGDAPPLVLDVSKDSPLRGRDQDLASLIKNTERGIYVANFWYLRMVAEMDGMLTGMTRDGLFAIHDGKLAGPLINMRWHDNPLRVLSAVTGVTEDKQLFGRSRLAGRGRQPLALMPGLRVEQFHFSSATKF